MEIQALCDILNGKGRVTAVKKLIDGSGNAVIDGLAGSSAAMLFAALPQRSCPYLIVVNDLDEAGYMYNDLCQIVGDKRVLIFPSGYKRDIKYGQVDAPNEILRTEVLNRWLADAIVLIVFIVFLFREKADAKLSKLLNKLSKLFENRTRMPSDFSDYSVV